MELAIEPIEGEFSVCKVDSAAELPLEAEFCFVGKTDCELSLVCRTADAPARTAEREDGWRAFRIAGTLDFSLVGILARISALMAGASIGIFAVSTYDTDYILVRGGDFARALEVLADAGYAVAG